MPGISIGQAQSLLQVTDRIIKQFPEVDRVFGKAGRAETPTDPAPLSMLETVITLRPQREWPRIPTWYSSWAPEWLRPALRHITLDHISQTELVAQLDAALKVSGLSNAWTMPVKGRIDMLTTGVRTPVGLKISGSDVAQIEAIGARVESLLSSVAGARSVFSERTGHGYFLDIELTGYLYVDLEGRDPASYIAEANRLLDKQAGLLPPGYSLAWSGQYEAMARVYERLKIALPLTLILIFFLLYANTRSLTKTLSAPGRSVLRHWRRVVPVPGRIQHERGSMGRVDCAPGSRRRDRSFYVALSRPGLRTGPPDGTADEPGRATRRHPHRGR